MASQSKAQRNAPCPCGSGKKLKRCCGDAQPAAADKPAGKSQKPLTRILLLVALVLAVFWITLEVRENWMNRADETATESHAPWEYDEANDRHWHAEHGHWHDGPPPQGAVPSPTDGLPAGRLPMDDGLAGGSRFGPIQTGPNSGAPQPQGLPPGVPTPEPWYYDRGNNRHWHAEHGHWHDGPPPLMTRPPAPPSPGQ